MFLKYNTIYSLSAVVIQLLLHFKLSIAIANSNDQNCLTMVDKKVVQSIESVDDFNNKLSGFLDKSQKLALLLDYDGTLAPLADHPDHTAMPPETEETLKWLVLQPQIVVAVISGRQLISVKSKVPFKNITYAGNHGIEIENPDGTRSDYELPENIKENYKKIVENLKTISKDGAWAEDKSVSLTFHYRDVKSKELIDNLIKEATKIIESHGFRASPAHEAIEAKPPVNWNKGEAAKYILKQKFGENWQTQVRVIFAGDDTTDEDVMRAIHGIGRSFRVSTNPNIETCADFRLQSPKQVALLLNWIKSIYS